jgi:hypothetical protein
VSDVTPFIQAGAAVASAVAAWFALGASNAARESAAEAAGLARRLADAEALRSLLTLASEIRNEGRLAESDAAGARAAIDSRSQLSGNDPKFSSTAQQQRGQVDGDLSVAVEASRYAESTAARFVGTTELAEATREEVRRRTHRLVDERMRIQGARERIEQLRDGGT